MILENLQAMFSNPLPEAEGSGHLDISAPIPDVIEKESATGLTTIPNKFKADIEALEAEYGKMVEGLTIEATLQEMLKICERERKRIDAYYSLVSFLAKNGITLTIKSQKSK
ncbi:MAG: hypothetical protein IJV44_12965 [Prevotella sp.]|jgi:hypothetical protein|nr:hypothetical protein [Prevotella sp.]